MKMKSFLGFLGLGLVALMLYACGSGGTDSGTVQLALTDAVDHNFSEVVISIKEVRAVPAGEEGAAEGGLPLIVSYAEPKRVNVLDLAFQQELLGEAVLPAGAYHQLRLVLEGNTNPADPANYLVMAGDAAQSKVPLGTPSGQQSGLKVVGHFDVAPGEVSVVVLDFDPARAVVESGQSGQWLFKPTGIRVVQTGDLLLTYGAVTGSVAVEETAGGTSVQTPVTEATLQAVPEGSATPIAAGAVNPEDGSFRLFLPPGAYELRVSADGFAPYTSLPDLYAVAEGVDTEAGVIVLEPLPAN